MRTLIVSSTFPQYAGDPRGQFVLRHWERRAERGDLVRALAPRTAWCDGSLRTPLDVTRFAYAPASWSSLSGRFGILENLRERPARALLLGPFYLALERALKRELKTFRPDLVAAHMLLPCGLAVARQCAPRGVPYVLYGHGTDVDLLLALPGPLLRWFGRRSGDALRVHLPSEEKRRRFALALGDPGNLVVERMEHCVPPPEWTESEPRSGVLCLGRLIQQKGVDVLLRAVASLDPAPSVDVAGEGPERGRLEALARRLGVKVRFHGLVEGAEKERLLRSAAVLCVPSRELRGGLSEGSPLVVIEAQRRGLAVVASRVGGIPELCPPESGAVLVTPDDPKALASALAKALRAAESRVLESA